MRCFAVALIGRRTFAQGRVARGSAAGRMGVAVDFAGTCGVVAAARPVTSRRVAGIRVADANPRGLAHRQVRDRENLEMLQDVAWTGNADPNLPRFEDRDSGVNFERVTSFKD